MSRQTGGNMEPMPFVRKWGSNVDNSEEFTIPPLTTSGFLSPTRSKEFHENIEKSSKRSKRSRSQDRSKKRSRSRERSKRSRSKERSKKRSRSRERSKKSRKGLIFN